IGARVPTSSVLCGRNAEADTSFSDKSRRCPFPAVPRRNAPIPSYDFGTTRVAVVALLTFTEISGKRSRGLVITKFPGHAVTFRSCPLVFAATPAPGLNWLRILSGKPPRAIPSAALLLGLYRIGLPPFPYR